VAVRPDVRAALAERLEPLRSLAPPPR
jgi:hypothetical protein